MSFRHFQYKGPKKPTRRDIRASMTFLEAMMGKPKCKGEHFWIWERHTAVDPCTMEKQIRFRMWCKNCDLFAKK